MKTKIICLLTAISISAGAQTNINLGAGFGNTFMNKNYEVKTPFLHATLEFPLSDNLSMGAYVSYAKAEWPLTGTDVCNNGNGNGNYSYAYTYTHKATHVIVALKTAYHFTAKDDKLDIYGALLLGNDFESDEYTLTTNPFCDKVNGLPFPFKKYDGFIWGIYGGARYRFTEHVGIFGELGYGISVFNVGLNLKL